LTKSRDKYKLQTEIYIDQLQQVKGDNSLPPQKKSTKRTQYHHHNQSNESQDNIGQESASIVQATLVKVEHRPQQQTVLNGALQSQQVPYELTP
jgi:hypothetical protein